MYITTLLNQLLTDGLSLVNHVELIAVDMIIKVHTCYRMQTYRLSHLDAADGHWSIRHVAAQPLPNALLDP
jgi:hypothetical protein